jgi:hypothetical protein
MFAFLLLLSGCRQSAKPADVVGTYKYTYESATVLLHLAPDGTFSEEITDRSQPAFRNDGTWHLDDRIEDQVNLWHYVKPHDPFGEFDPSFRNSEPQEFSYPIDHWFGHTYLVPHPDDAHHFDKID